MHSSPKYSKRCIIISLSIFMAALAHLHAEVIVHDQILIGGENGYASDGTLYGQNPASGMGWSSGWSGAPASTVKTLDTNLAIPGITNGGGSIRFNARNGGQAVLDKRPFAPASSQSTLWFSTIFQVQSVYTTEMMLGFMSDPASGSFEPGATWGGSTNGNTQQGFAWGVNANQSGLGSTLTLQYQTNAASASTAGSLSTIDTGLSLTANVPMLMLAQLQINESGDNDVLNVWLLTSAPESQAALGEADFTISTSDLVTNSANLSNVALWYLRPEDTYSGYSNFDYINVGTSFEDVTSVPEHAQSGLLAGLFISLIVLGYRSRKASCEHRR